MLQELGLQPIESDSKMECLTMCHGGDSHKLIYYKDTHMFMCYTHCGSMDIFTLLSKVRACSFHEALIFVANRFNIQSIITTGFDGVPNEACKFLILNQRRLSCHHYKWVMFYDYFL